MLAGWVACYLGKHGQTEVVGNFDITIGTQCHIIYNKALGIVKGGVEGHGTYCGLPVATTQLKGGCGLLHNCCRHDDRNR